MSSIAGSIRVNRRVADESKIKIDRELGNARIRDYWYRTQQALREKEEALGEKDYIDVNSEHFICVDPGGLLAKN